MAEPDGGKTISIIRSIRSEIKAAKEDIKSFSESLHDVMGTSESGGTASRYKRAAVNASSSVTPVSAHSSAPSGTATPPPSPGSNPMPQSPRMSYGFGSVLSSFAKKGASAFLAGMAFLPTGQEAVGAQLLEERIRFYSGSRRGAAMQSFASSVGTPTSPLDAPLATNTAIEQGLLPGLSNFAGGSNRKNPFTGILGSAALASNLAPGIGIQGGAGVVGAINAPQNVNMLRMFGINIRPGDGSKPADLASIIDQLYDILSKSSTVTKEMIAISAMPGNALDSILNQYFGGDPVVKNVIISGLIQKASSFKSKISGSLYDLGLQSQLKATGGLPSGTISVGRRSAAELNMIEKTKGGTLKGLMGADNALMSFYDKLGEWIGKSDWKGKSLTAAQSAGIAIESLAGARGGAGGALINAVVGSSPTGLLGLSTIAGLGFAGAEGLFGPKAATALTHNSFGLFSQTANAANYGSAGNTGATKATGPLYTGAITINVQAPPGNDPYAIGSLLTQQMQAGLVYS